MGQRLGVAAVRLGDPATLVLDEPTNGLDLDGMRWIRAAQEPRCRGPYRLPSSHLMAEMAVTADHVIAVGQGRLLRDQPMAEFIDDAAVETVRVRSSANGQLAALLLGCGGTSKPDGEALSVEGLSSDRIGTRAASTLSVR